MEPYHAAKVGITNAEKMLPNRTIEVVYRNRMLNMPPGFGLGVSAQCFAPSQITTIVEAMSNPTTKPDATAKTLPRRSNPGGATSKYALTVRGTLS